MYRGLWLWEARCVVFYEGLRLWGGSGSNEAVAPGWSDKEGPHVRGGSELGSYEDLTNLSRILALRGSICRVLRGYEALGEAPILTKLWPRVGPLKKDLTCVGDLSWDHMRI